MVDGMNREDIIRMAQEVGLDWLMHNRFYEDHLDRFAALVAAAERESMIEQGWRQCAKGQRTTQFCGMVEQAVQEEREACAKVVLGIANNDAGNPYKQALRIGAEAIRAREKS